MPSWVLTGSKFLGRHPPLLRPPRTAGERHPSNMCISTSTLHRGQLAIVSEMLGEHDATRQSELRERADEGISQSLWPGGGRSALIPDRRGDCCVMPRPSSGSSAKARHAPERRHHRPASLVARFDGRDGRRTNGQLRYSDPDADAHYDTTPAAPTLLATRIKLDQRTCGAARRRQLAGERRLDRCGGGRLLRRRDRGGAS